MINSLKIVELLLLPLLMLSMNLGSETAASPCKVDRLNPHEAIGRNVWAVRHKYLSRENAGRMNGMKVYVSFAEGRAPMNLLDPDKNPRWTVVAPCAAVPLGLRP